MKPSQDADKINIFLNRAVENIYPSKDYLEQLLRSNKQLSVYLGIDPTGEFLHLGHFMIFKKLKLFQELGHKVILLIGDFTAMIGDPTDKMAARQPLSREQVINNCRNYKQQASKFLDFEGENPVVIKYNSDWLAKLTFFEIIDLAAHFTVQQMLERDMFAKRLAANKPISLHEFLYPLMQGYDSVHMGVDGEIGGNDQTFNMLAGRDLMKAQLNKEKFVITIKLLADPTGKKMGKSEGNMVRLNDSPNEIYGKIMSWPDGMIFNGFELCTNSDMKEIEKLCIKMNKGELNPRDLKMRLAQEIVGLIYDNDQAIEAQKYFVKVFSQKEIPQEMPEYEITSKNITDALVEIGLCTSKSEARRVIAQKGLRLNDQAVSDENLILEPSPKGVILQKGKRFFAKLFVK